MTLKAERRVRARVAARVPVRIRSTPGVVELTGETRDVSSNGIFLYTNSQLLPGADLELVLMLPSELTDGEKCWVCCLAKVVRVETGQGGEFGVAAEIRRLDVLPEIAV